MENTVWITKRKKYEFEGPTAVLGSSGLRSIGKLVVDDLIEQTKSELIADLYSIHLPSVYQTKPSYAADPTSPGEGGALIESGYPDLPKVQFYGSEPSLVLVRGYHPNFAGQYEVAEKVVDFLDELRVKRLIVVAGFGSKEEKIVCAATTKELITEMKEKHQIDIGYKGPFYGFSGLVFGLSKLKNIDSVALFSSTQPKEGDLEAPDNDSSKRTVEKLSQILKL